MNTFFRRRLFFALSAACCFIPALGIAAVGYAVMIVFASGKPGPKSSIAAVEWAIVVLVAILTLAELVRVVHHWSLFETHMAYQVARKLHLSVQTRLMKPQGLILLISFVSVAFLLWRRHAYRSQAPGAMFCQWLELLLVFLIPAAPRR